ncbi:MAG: response regulator [Bacteroidia bacterium]|nr:response regulator [Bacteroidia bacterium]
MKKPDFYCVLLVDDDEVSLFISQTILLRHKLADHTHTALNGDAALRFLQDQLIPDHPEPHKPNLIFLDIDMPVLDGFGFLDAYDRLIFPGKDAVRIVMLTSSSNPKDLEKAHQHGISEVISKPLTQEKVLHLTEG